MTDYDAPPDSSRVTAWAIGGMTFAASMLVLVGCFQALAGLVALFDDNFYVVTRSYTFDLDTTAWGWIHLIVGIAVAATGFALFAGKTWAAITALFLAMLSAITSFLFIPYYPWWALLVIALDAWVIWSLTRPGAIET